MGSAGAAMLRQGGAHRAGACVKDEGYPQTVYCRIVDASYHIINLYLVPLEYNICWPKSYHYELNLLGKVRTTAQVRRYVRVCLA